MSDSSTKKDYSENSDEKEDQSIEKKTKSKKSKKPRCRAEGCRKKLGLIPFRCKCGLSFCSLHRMPGDHNCQFDWQEDGKLKLQKDLLSAKSLDNHGLLSY
tara:strand:+ start:1625 stop:1927 length:303 start_codon:yes stop_codon:yes gene_type:complete